MKHNWAVASCVVAIASAVAGCYIEGSIAYHPTITQRVTTPNPTGDTVVTGDGGGWSAAINIGIYLDINTRHGGLGVGFSPSSLNGTGIAPSSQPVASASAKGTALRGDVGLPTHVLGSVFADTLTFSYKWLRDTSIKLGNDEMGMDVASSNGKQWFLGVGPTVRINFAEERHILSRLAIGVERFAVDATLYDGRTVEVSSTGIGAHVMISPALLGKLSGEIVNGWSCADDPQDSNWQICHYDPTVLYRY